MAARFREILDTFLYDNLIYLLICKDFLRLLTENKHILNFKVFVQTSIKSAKNPKQAYHTKNIIYILLKR